MCTQTVHFVFVCIVSVVLSGCGPKAFQDDFEAISIDSDKWQVDAEPDCRLLITDEKARSGRSALRIDAKSGDRCEVVPRIYPAIRDKFIREPFEKLREYRFSIYLADNPESSLDDSQVGSKPSGGNTVVAQWHSSPDPLIGDRDGRGPPLALRVADGRWGITYGSDDNFRSRKANLANNWHWAGDIESGRWTDWRFLVYWSHDEAGLTEVWRDDVLVFLRVGPNAFNDIRGVYLKLGLYHPVGNWTIYLDRVVISNPAE